MKAKFKSNASKIAHKPETRFMKPSYVVLCHRIDCGDEITFTLEGEDGKDTWDNIKDARKAMREDYAVMCDDWSAEWTVDRKEHCIKRTSTDEIFMDIPCANEDGEEDWIRCHWKIVKM